MAVEVRVDYVGDLRCRAVHGPSGVELVTDAPVDNSGRGESYSPTDLVATALGACLLTVMGIVAARRGVNLRGATARVEKHMVADPGRRIGRLPVRIVIPAAVAPDDRSVLERAAYSCPVLNSLDSRVRKEITFVWGRPTDAASGQ